MMFIKHDFLSLCWAIHDMHKPQLFSDPGKKGTLVGEDHFEWGSHQRKKEEGATEQLRNYNSLH